MERKTKKMAATERQIAEKRAEYGRLSDLRRRIAEHDPQFPQGKDLKQKQMDEIAQKLTDIGAEIQNLVERLDLETMEMIAEIDVDFKEPTPADAMRGAS